MQKSPLIRCSTQLASATRPKRTLAYVDYSEAGSEAQAMRRAENEEYRQRQSMGLTGVRIGRRFQADLPEYKKSDAVDRGDTLLNCVPWPKLVQPVPSPWKGQKNKTK